MTDHTLLSPGAAVDLSNCALEPIHIPSSIQPRGVLLAARISDLRIAFASENTGDMLGVPLAIILEQGLAEVLGAEAVASIRAALGSEQNAPKNILTIQAPPGSKTFFDVFAHYSGNLMIVEMEPCREGRRCDLVSAGLNDAVRRLKQWGTLDELLQALPPMFRQLTGYDRLMVYRFNQDEHGEVVAEEKEAGMEPFLGLHYPASDIPAQARRLYLLQRFRLIDDIHYKPVRVCANHVCTDETPLDMTYCQLRSVSPIHIEYLENMGVGSALSVSLIVDHCLWGMIVFHHRAALTPPPETRALCDHLGQVISQLIAVMQQAERDADRLKKNSLLEMLTRAVEGDTLVTSAIFEQETIALSLVGAEGALLCLDNEAHLIGQTPPLPDALSIMAAMYKREPDRISSSHCLSEIMPDRGDLAASASGVLLAPFKGPGNGLLWFRREAARTVNWAGNPNSAKHFDEDTLRMSPRKSFAAWQEVYVGQSLPWREVELEAAAGFQGAIARNLLRRAAAEEINYKGQIEAIGRSYMMIEFTIDGRIVRANENYLRAFGYSWADVEGQPHSIFVHPAYRNSDEYVRFWDALRRGEALDGEFERVDRHGHSVWLQGCYAPMLDLHGVPQRIVKFAYDIGPRIRLQAEMKTVHEQLRITNERAVLATDSGRVGVWDWDVDKDVMLWDAWMYRLHGLEPTAKEQAYDLWRRHLHPEDRCEAEKAIQDALAGIRPFDPEFRIVWPDGSVHFIKGAGQITRDAHGRATRIVGTNIDITQLKRAQAEAESANQAKSKFLANMSHEIRTPVNAIVGMTHLAQRRNPSPQQRDYLTKIDTAAQSLLNIMNDILDFSKIEAGKLALEEIPFSVDTLLTDLLDIVADKAEQKRLQLVLSVAPTVAPSLVGDPYRIGQILINLVNNAVKFTEKGKVSIEITSHSIQGRLRRIGFSVSDTGIGMTPGQLHNLFESFNQADATTTRKYGGTGLGLAISRQLAELMGGTLLVKSELGVGSTFHFSVPLMVATAALPKMLSVSGGTAVSKNVLIVDDSEDTRESFHTMLRRMGHHARAVSSGEEALSSLIAACERDIPFDVVLMDWRLPGLNGLDTVRRIQSLPGIVHHPAVFIVSAFAQDEVLAGTHDVVLEGFLVKPIDEKHLAAAINRVRGQGTEHLEAHSEARTPQGVRGTGNYAAGDAAGTSLDPVRLKGRRVLLVEDNEINRELATELLSDLGIVVSVAVDGREGVDRIAAEPFDLVLMDIQMPVMDGLTATRMVRSDTRFHALPIIAMTAHAMSGDREKSLTAGMNDHLTKPISPDRLTEALLRWLPVRTTALAVAQAMPALSNAGTEELPSELAPFNLPNALVRTNGKPKLLRKMMLTFQKQYAQAATELRALLSEQKMEQAERLVHSLKGSARTLEANELGDAAEAVEIALRTGATREMRALIGALEQALVPAVAAAATLERRLAPANSAEPSRLKSGGTILIVDDDPGYRELLTDIFSKEHVVLSAADGPNALTIATKMVPDVVLLDVMMPGLDGYEVCNRLKRERSTCDIPVIFLTGLGDVDNESRALAMGAVDYVTKPINPLAVRARVNHQIELKRAHDRLIQHATEELEARLRKEAERAEEIQRISKHELELRDHFLSHVSHELRSPLTAIYLFSTLIADGLAGATNPQQDEYLGFIVKNIGQLEAMIQDLLLVTAAKTGKLEVHLHNVSLNTAILDAIHTLQEQAAVKGVALSSSVRGEMTAYADKVRLLQVLIILCDNAIKFTPAGGRVTVAAHRVETDPNFLLVEVSDTGCGIQPEMAERIFEHLYQITNVSDAGRNGLGLGLYIARDLVTRQGGRIWAEPLPAAGSRFCFTVPAFQNQMESLPAWAPADGCG